MSIFSKILKIYNAGYRQQHEATCGPSSVILAAYGLDLTIKNAEDWINPNFSRWLPVEKFLIRGMALHELYLTSELIYRQAMDIKIKRAYFSNYSLFEKDIQKSFQDLNSVITINYVQSDIVQTFNQDDKTGHYSPIIDFNESEDKILIADVDPEVKLAYWANIKDVFQSMSQVLPALGLPRGWLVLSKPSL